MNTFKLMTFLVLGVFWGQGCGAESRSSGDGYGNANAEGEPCNSPGESQFVSCSRCGIASQLCGEDGYWDAPGECLYQGDCNPGDHEIEKTTMCGERQRLCDNECHWFEWDQTIPDGECEPHVETIVEDGCGLDWDRTDTCSEDCVLIEGECESDSPCGGHRRTSPAHAEEICIPGGYFIRGDNTLGRASPAAEVYVSSFFIDRYPVTNERYQQCIDDGICLPTLDLGNSDDLDHRPVQSVLPRAYAETFCEWDGGRRLPTEAEWEKSARGPSPIDDPYIWGDEPSRCDLILTEECSSYDLHGGFYYFPDDVDELPGTRSYYGVEMLIGGGYEWVSDYYSTSYYSDSNSRENPQGPETGIYFVLRGATRSDDVEDMRISMRYAWAAGMGNERRERFITFRCARPVTMSE